MLLILDMCIFIYQKFSNVYVIDVTRHDMYSLICCEVLPVIYKFTLTVYKCFYCKFSYRNINCSKCVFLWKRLVRKFDQGR